MQQGMLFHHLYSLDNDENDVYMMQLVCKINEDVDEDILLNAWEIAVERHSVLRTSFLWEGLAEPQQIVHDNVTIPIEREDWSGFSANEQEEKLDNYLDSDWKRGFDLSKKPLLRLLLVRNGKYGYTFVFSNHHTILDGRSRKNLLEEVITCYKARLKGEEPKLQKPRGYRDYIDWLTEQDFSQSEEFWRGFLEGLSDPTSITASLKVSSSGLTQNRRAKRALVISESLTADLYQFSQNYKVSLNIIIQCAWSIFLSRYCASDDVIFGATRACRHLGISGATDIIGPFINTLPVRISFSEDMSVLDCLYGLKKQQVSVRDHEHTPLVNVQQWCGLSSGTSLFDTIVVFDSSHLNDDYKTYSGAGLNGSVEVFSESNYPLSLEGYGGRKLDLRICYDPSLFDEAAIDSMCGHLRMVFDGILADPEKRACELQMLTENERRQLLVEWNRTEYHVPEQFCLHELFEAQVERTPEDVALIFEDQELNYRELNCRANRLANYLQGLRVGPEVLVGICVDRSFEMVIGILGILKAGGAYVALDPDYPEERLNYILSDGNISILLTQEKLRNKLPTQKRKSICLDSDWQEIEQQSAGSPAKRVTADNLAYVIYTSGSTGKPKGVMVEHKAVAEHCLIMKNHYQLNEKDKVLQFASYTFDQSVEQIFSTLICGASLVLIRSNQLATDELHKILMKTGVTVANFPPAYWTEMVHNGEQEKDEKNSLRLVIIGGDVLQPEAARQTWRRHPESLVLMNAFGPTEAVITSTLLPISMDTVEKWRQSIPIGRPTANTQIYIMDSHAQPVPVNVPGELYIGGSCLARGYLNRRELTEEKFVTLTINREHLSIGPNDISSTDEHSLNIRMYKTGDLVRWLPDGNIDFLGRIDHQVKIRGFRIELGEIEATLIENPSVREAIVVAREERPGGKQLVGYIVPVEEQALTVTELRDSLKEKLPYYMIPSIFVILDSLPLLPSGKVNRRALPAPKQSTRDLSQLFVTPRDEVEADLAKIWEEVLGVSPVGVTENFFDLGGHSLLAVRLMALIQDRFGVNIHLNTLWFDGATIEYLANLLREPSFQKTDPYLVSIQPEGIKPPLFLIHTVGGGNLFHYESIIRFMPTERPVYGILPQGLDDGQRPHIDIRLMAAHCVQVMRYLQTDGPFYLCGFSSGGVVAYEIAQQLRRDGCNDSLLIMIDAINPRLTDTIMECVAFMREEYRQKRYRALQERAYHYLLTRLGLSNLRRLKSLGESHRWALWSYAPEPYPGSAVLVEAMGSSKKYGDTHLGWEGLVRGGLNVETITGSHGLVVKNEQAEQVASLIREHLDRSDEQYHETVGNIERGNIVSPRRTPHGVTE